MRKHMLVTALLLVLNLSAQEAQPTVTTPLERDPILNRDELMSASKWGDWQYFADASAGNNYDWVYLAHSPCHYVDFAGGNAQEFYFFASVSTAAAKQPRRVSLGPSVRKHAKPPARAVSSIIGGGLVGFIVDPYSQAVRDLGDILSSATRFSAVDRTTLAFQEYLSGSTEAVYRLRLNAVRQLATGQ